MYSLIKESKMDNPSFFSYPLIQCICSVAHIAMFTSDTCGDVVGCVWERLGLSSEGFSLIHMRTMVLADKNPTKLSHM